jgi:RNA polymerase sigma factor (TIGR02999 family)
MVRERRGDSFQATALVNEAYLRLLDARRVNWQDRAHFLAVAARLMRRVLVDRARDRGYQKRGGAAVKVALDEALLAQDGPNIDLLALDEALTALDTFDERACRVIEMRYFAGLTAEETAAVLNMSVDTVMRDARCARAWLARRLSTSS